MSESTCAIEAAGLGFEYRPGTPVLTDVALRAEAGELLGVLGPNGSGKTTLLRCLLGQVAPDAGQVILGHGVEIGYFDQHLDTLDDATPVVDAIRPDHLDSDTPKRRDLLARFGLTGDAALQTVASLSGGERCRAALARLAAAEANLLVLDEPTNHLDLWALDALERSLNAFEGTVLFVSHDRYFVNRMADHLLVVESDRFRVVEGNYATYLDLVRRGLIGIATHPAGDAEAGETRAAKSGKRKQEGDNRPPPDRPKRRFPYRKVEDLESEIFEREAQIEALHAALAEPETHRGAERVRQIKAELAEQHETLKTLYAHWEEATELNW